jgi:hypothetical protein
MPSVLQPVGVGVGVPDPEPPQENPIVVVQRTAKARASEKDKDKDKDKETRGKRMGGRIGQIVPISDAVQPRAGAAVQCARR